MAYRNLDEIINEYQNSFSSKVYNDENNDTDLLMDIFGITPELKRENRQYWGRELGKCWEYLVVEACKDANGFSRALRMGLDEPCDLVIGEYAIDTKYRVGSGDSGTLKKFKQYGALLREKGYIPVFLFLRTDSLPAAMKACTAGGWEIYEGEDTFEFIEEVSGVDLENYLISRKNKFPIIR